jgi:hypothetical protein
LPGFGAAHPGDAQARPEKFFFVPPLCVLTERQRTPCILTERQLAAQQRCQNAYQEAAQQRCQDALQVPQAA